MAKEVLTLTNLQLNEVNMASSTILLHFLDGCLPELDYGYQMCHRSWNKPTLDVMASTHMGC